MLLESTVINGTIENNFWSKDETALNVLLDKLEKSNKSSIAVQNYFKQRAQIEEEYGNKLLQLSQLHQIEECFSSALSSSSEMSARAHVDLGQNIRNMLETPLENYLKDQESIKSFMTSQMKESQSSRIWHTNNIQNTRNAYVNEYKNPNASFEDIDMLDFEYQEAIRLMQSKADIWVCGWQESCKTFQSLEANRLDYLKAMLKTFSSMAQCTYSIDDQTCERLLIAMDDLNTDHEILDFIMDHRTGSTKPEIPKYARYNEAEDGKTSTRAPRPPPLRLEPPRKIREINIPIKQDEELRSVNDQLKKIPSPWDHCRSSVSHNSDSLASKSQKDIALPQLTQYPHNPVYRSNKKAPSQSDPVLNNKYSRSQVTAVEKEESAYKSTLITPQEQEKYIKHKSHGAPPSPVSPLSPTKKSSLLLSSIGFFKKKKSNQQKQQPEVKHYKDKKRLSSNHGTVRKPVVLEQPAKDITPPSPMFSPIDFYFSPADIDKNLKRTT